MSTTAPAEKHICKFRRHTFSSGNTTYFCANGCNKKVKPALALGKKSICWRCGDVFVMNEYSIRLAKPHCDACHKPKNPADIPEESPIVVPFVTPSASQPVALSPLSERLRAAVGGNPIDSEEDI